MLDIPLLSVSELSHIIQSYIEGDGVFNDIKLNAELTQVKPYHLGNQVYCYLSDGKTSINAVIYSSALKRMDFALKNGLKVFVRGKLCFFPKRGSLIFQINYMSLSGDGLLKQQLAALKDKLTKEGLFDLASKKKLIKYPRHIAIITAYDSAAMWDIVRVFQNMAAHVNITIVSAVMQGDQCPRSVCAAFERIKNNDQPFDCILLTRGGGSAQDLAAFNDELIVRAIAACDIPVMTAIGHDIDHTLSDLAADVAESTPTSAAKHLCFNYQLIKQRISNELLTQGPRLFSSLNHYFQQLQHLLKFAKQHMQKHQQQLQIRYEYATQKLHQSNPLAILQKGYSISTNQQNTPLVSYTQCQLNQCIHTRLADGYISSKITDIFPEKPN